MKGLKGYVKLLSGLVVFVAYLLINLISVDFAPQDFLGVFISSGLMMLCWIMIRDAFAEQGLISGQKDKEVKATKKEHLITSNAVSTYKGDFNIWCENKNADRLKQKRISILSGSSLLYEEYFDEIGNIKKENGKTKQVPEPELTDNKKINKANKKRHKQDCKLLNKARFAYVAPYEVEDICAKEDISSKKKLFGISVKRWKTIKIISSIITSLVICLMLSFISAKEKTLGTTEILILIFQILIMAGSAFSFYFSALNFICGDWREGLIQKTRVMEEFYRNVVGTIDYENDIKKEDGSVVVGKKIFKERANYTPLYKNKEDSKNETDKPMEVASQECAKQTNDSVGDNSRADILESSDSDSTSSVDNKSVVVDGS